MIVAGLGVNLIGILLLRCDAPFSSLFKKKKFVFPITLVETNQ